MRPNPTRSALLVIDMENGFVEPEGGHCIPSQNPPSPLASGPWRPPGKRASPCFS